MPRLPRLSPASRRVIRVVGTVVVLVVVGVLFARALIDNWDNVAEQDLAFDWRYVVATVLFAIAVPVSGVLWGAIVNRLAPGNHLGIAEAIRVHSISWLLKYIPGQVGSLLNKVMWGASRGYSRALIAITFVYENVFLQMASIVPSVVILLFAAGGELFSENPVSLLVPLLALIPLVFVLLPRPFHAVLDVAARRVLKQPLPADYFLSVPATSVFLAAFTIPRIINGVGFVLIALAITDVPPGQWLAFAAAYTLAGAIGILAVFVPSGLGVREAVVFACLVFLGTGHAEAVLISLLARLLSTVADGLVGLTYTGLRLAARKEPPR